MDGEGGGTPPAKRPRTEGGPSPPGAAPPTGGDKGEEGAAATIHDAQDEELDEVGLPTGWRSCPAMGLPVDRFIPMKVPLGAHWDKYIQPELRFNVDMAKKQADRLVAGRKWGNLQAEVRLVIDLTNSSRYYDAARWHELGVQYIKIPCRGRGQAPEPEAVNDFVFEVYRYLQAFPAGMILIHCTHGFNRTGYMVCSYLARAQAQTMAKALFFFSQQRPPGIYKHYYIRELFRYYHEAMDPGLPLPAPPPWKAGDSPEPKPEPEGGPFPGEMCHDDVVGEEVPPGEAEFIQAYCMDLILGPDLGRERLWFPGSQPVSLDSTNLDLLAQRRYWVTWKADGTRYMLLLMRWGTYLIDRKFAVRRVQMRWPTAALPPDEQQRRGMKVAPVGMPHHRTLLDGEMVVDSLLDSGAQERRFLAYDLMAVGGQPVGGLPWKERYELIRREVMEPRKLERELIARGKWSSRYQYDTEPFHARRKEFWPLHKADSLINRFMTQLSHECDGLILQACDDAYVPGTCPELLKWKFAHMNSVDFRLRIVANKEPQLELLETRRSKGVGRGYKVLPGARVLFAEGEDPSLLNFRIVECAWDLEAGAWRFMRERRDKDTANAMHVYESVARSIADNIQEGQLLEHVKAVLGLPLYDRDMGRGGGGGQPGAAPRTAPRQQQAAPSPPQQAAPLPPPQQEQHKENGAPAAAADDAPPDQHENGATAAAEAPS